MPSSPFRPTLGAIASVPIAARPPSPSPSSPSLALIPQALVALYENEGKPGKAVDFIKSQLGAPTPEDMAALQAEKEGVQKQLEEAQKKIADLEAKIAELESADK